MWTALQRWLAQHVHSLPRRRGSVAGCPRRAEAARRGEGCAPSQGPPATPCSTAPARTGKASPRNRSQCGPARTDLALRQIRLPAHVSHLPHPLPRQGCRRAPVAEHAARSPRPAQRHAPAALESEIAAPRCCSSGRFALRLRAAEVLVAWRVRKSLQRTLLQGAVQALYSIQLCCYHA